MMTKTRYIVLTLAILISLHYILSFSHEGYCRATSLDSLKGWAGIGHSVSDDGDERTPKVYHEPPYKTPVPEKYYLTPDVNGTMPRKANATIVMLARNGDINGVFNTRFGYPYVFLNEEPFSDEFKRSIFALTKNKVEFGLIPKEHWYQPDWIDEERARASRKKMEEEHVIYGGSVPYRNMCRFNSGFFFRHELLDKYRYYWRVEPDVRFFCTLSYDPFLFMQDESKKYGFTISLPEYGATIPTLWTAVREFVAANPQHVLPLDEGGMGFLSDDGGETYNGCHSCHNLTPLHAWTWAWLETTSSSSTLGGGAGCFVSLRCYVDASEMLCFACSRAHAGRHAPKLSIFPLSLCFFSLSHLSTRGYVELTPRKRIVWSNFEIGDLDLWRGEAYRAFLRPFGFEGGDCSSPPPSPSPPLPPPSRLVPSSPPLLPPPLFSSPPPSSLSIRRPAVPSHGFYYERWGDAPVHSIGAALFARKDQIGRGGEGREGGGATLFILLVCISVLFPFSRGSGDDHRTACIPVSPSFFIRGAPHEMRRVVRGDVGCLGRPTLPSCALDRGGAEGRALAAQDAGEREARRDVRLCGDEGVQKRELGEERGCQRCGYAVLHHRQPSRVESSRVEAARAGAADALDGGEVFALANCGEREGRRGEEKFVEGRELEEILRSCHTVSRVFPPAK
ncbi:glycolipid 2-alpha-mannosyltransferase-domain-containing protein [Mycena olivaceomarginata]|nr:glycolipid 2-alpha-mannosyltransferase-domain-containing protein [Mycena olivaceomarginata]